MDEKGFSSVEIFVVLILLLLAIGVILEFTQKSSETLSTAISEGNLEKITTETCDNLINNPGSPKNWNELRQKENVIVGLAILNEDNKTIPNSISFEKFLAVGEDYNKLINENIFKNQVKSSISLTAFNENIEQKTWGSSVTSENIFSINRIVTCDFYKKFSINSFQNNGKCNQYHIGEHSCNYFKIFKSYLKTTDYYLLFDENSYNDVYYSLDTTLIPSISKKVTNDVIKLNNEIENKLIFSEDGIIFVHTNKEDVKAVLVGVPKDFDKKYLKYEYFISNQCEFTLKTSY